MNDVTGTKLLGAIDYNFTSGLQTAESIELKCLTIKLAMPMQQLNEIVFYTNMESRYKRVQCLARPGQVVYTEVDNTKEQSCDKKVVQMKSDESPGESMRIEKQPFLSMPGHLLALQALLVDGESSLQELLLLLEVDGLQTGSHGGTGSATSVHDVAAVVVLGRVQQGLDTGLGVRPGTGVERLLLAPHNVLGVGVAVKVLLQLSPREGVQLLNTGDGGVADALGLTVLSEGSVDLTRAQNDALNLLGLLNGGSVSVVRDDPLEVGVIGEGLDVRASNRVTEQSLGEEDDKSYRR